MINSDYSAAFRPFGIHGWIGPEMYCYTKEYTFWVDIFSLGCIFGLVLTKGGPPYSEVRYFDWDAQKAESVVHRIIYNDPVILIVDNARATMTTK